MSIALSWSRWSDYAQCPLKFSLKYLVKAQNFKMDDKNKSAHLQRGENLHKQLEDYVKWKHGTIEAKPAMLPETEAVVPLIEKLWATSDVVLPETQIANNRNWEKVEWFAKDAHYRAILDLIAARLAQKHAILWDYKSGKYQDYLASDDDPGQLHLSAAMVIKMKGYDFVDVSYLFLDSRRPAGIRVTQDNVDKIIKIFDERHAMVNSETQWKPTKNDYCKWCEATKDQCVHSSKTPGLKAMPSL